MHCESWGVGWFVSFCFLTLVGGNRHYFCPFVSTRLSLRFIPLAQVIYTHTHTHTQYWSCTPILKLYTQGGPTHTHPQYWSRSLRFIPLARVIYTHTHTHTHTQYWSRSLRFIPLAQVIHTHTHTHTHTILKLYTNTEAIYSRRALCRSLEFFLCSSLFSSTLCWEKVDLINN